MLEFLKKYKEVISYLFFGGVTTLVNIVCYSLLYYIAGISNTVSNVIAWVVSVLVAYVTNKLFVFENKGIAFPAILVEIASFFGCRVLTGVMDVAVMYLFVDVLLLNALLMKIISNVLVIILNYIASKFFIFRKVNGDEGD
jgi:putative flippase GtrA